MSQYKSAIRVQDSAAPEYSSHARQLQELFPNWSVDDLLLLLNDVGGDIQVAATRISEGTVERWGEVSRKKERKQPTPTKLSSSPRGDARGGRGGRGGRGVGRGGAVSRGRGGPPRATANGHLPRKDNPSVAPPNGAPSIPDSAKPVVTDASVKQESHDQQYGPSPSHSGWTETSSQLDSTAIATSVSGFGSTLVATANSSNDISLANKPPSKSPATSKLSWAQVAKPHEKTAPIPPPQSAPSIPAQVPELEAQGNGWEEPTTVEAPTWDDEPQQVKPSVPAGPWPPSAESANELTNQEPSKPSLVSEEKSELAEETPPRPEPVVELKVDAKLESPLPPAPEVLAAQAASTPSPKLTGRPAAVSHRSSARHKLTDQPVTMPISFGSGIEKVGMQFGSLSLSEDGSVTIQNEPEVATSETESSPVSQIKAQQEPSAPHPPSATAPSSTSLSSVYQQQQSISHPPQNLPPTQTQTLPTSISQPIQPTQPPSSQTAAAGSPLQQFAQQNHTQPQTTASNGNIHPQPQQASQPPNLHQQPQHQAQHVPHLPQQLQQNHSSHSYTQHGLPTHIDPQQASNNAVQQQPLQSATHSNYFRQAEGTATAPYFHTPTPPAAQSQDSTYSSFGQSGGQGLHQGSHLGGFSTPDYNYSENSRAFYDTYQQSAFGSRNPIGHDDVKGIPGSQQSANSSLPTATAPAPPQHASTNQPPGSQGPQQSYGPPIPPYYYSPSPYPSNQFYGPYSTGYLNPQYVKYPLFPPGPPGPGSAANPTAKQSAGNVGVQPQANPYNQGLYQQAAYDEYQHPHHSQHQHQHTHSLGLSQGVGVGSADYGKQLYVGGGQGGMQGFMGLGGQSGGGGNGPASNAGPRNATSPDTPYKPYASKDVSGSANRGAPVQSGGQGQGQPQGQGQGPNQGPQGQSFYGGNRFGGNVGSGGAGGVGGGGPQQSGHHQQGGPHLGYPQGAGENNFYPYQQPLPRGQFWQ